MFENLKIRQRLKKAFAIIVVISSIAGVLGALAMIVTMNRYQHALTNYGFSQGDIGKAMTVFTDVRSATRGIIGYNDPDLVDGLITTHDEKKQAFLEYWEVVGETVVSSKEKELYDQVNEQIQQYWLCTLAIFLLCRLEKCQQRLVDDRDPGTGPESGDRYGRQRDEWYRIPAGDSVSGGDPGSGFFCILCGKRRSTYAEAFCEKLV